MIWRYSTLTRSGFELKGTAQGSRDQVIKLIKTKELELISLQPDIILSFKNLLRYKSIPPLVLSQFFEDFHNMLETGMSLKQILFSLKETTHYRPLRKILDALDEYLNQGFSLTDSFIQSESFPWIVISTLRVGERAGNILQITAILAQYFKRQEETRSRLINALAYPLCILGLLLALMIFVSLRIVPKMAGLLPAEALNSFSTRALLFLTFFIQKTWIFLLFLPIALGFVILKFKERFAEKLEGHLYRMPVLGEAARESGLSLYFLNLYVLQHSGVPVIQALKELYDSHKSILSQKFMVCRDYILGGSSFWEAVKRDAFFPSVVVFTLRRGEEMTKLDEYYLRLSEYFRKRVNFQIDAILQILQPVLLALCGAFLLFIALSFLVPIYSNLGRIASGG